MTDENAHHFGASGLSRRKVSSSRGKCRTFYTERGGPGGVDDVSQTLIHRDSVSTSAGWRKRQRLGRLARNVVGRELVGLFDDRLERCDVGRECVTASLGDAEPGLAAATDLALA